MSKFKEHCVDMQFMVVVIMLLSERQYSIKLSIQNEHLYTMVRTIVESVRFVSLMILYQFALGKI